MTYPEIGNYGINPQDTESRGLFLSGFIVKSLSQIASNYRSQQSLQDYLIENKIPAIAGIDTRSLVRHIRDCGAMQAKIILGDIKNLDEEIKEVQNYPSLEGQNLASLVTCQEPYRWSQGTKSFLLHGEEKRSDPQFKVVAYDFGIKSNILRLLTDHGCRVLVVPADYPAEKVLAENPDGVFLSNGPGDPAACVAIVDNIKKLFGKKPVFGICLGHQIIAIALGLKSFKLKFGHHGGNQPVKDLTTGKVEITAQNHGFAIDSQNLPDEVMVTHINLNDETVEGIQHKKWPLFGIQYHPESAPGPHDSHYLFNRFIDMMGEG